MRDGREPAVALGAQADALDRWRAIADQREHLLPREGELHGPPRRPRRQHGEDQRWMGERFAAECAADVGRDDAHTLGRESKRLGDIVPDPVGTLVRVVEGHALAVAAPDHHRRVRFHWIVVLSGRRVGVIERDGRCCKCCIDVALGGIRLV